MNNQYSYYPKLNTYDDVIGAGEYGDYESGEGFSPGAFESRFHQAADYPSREIEEEFNFGDFPKAVLKAMRRGLESVGISLAGRFGLRDENKLSDLVFFVRHPERRGRLLRKGERNFDKLSQEWLAIRDELVRPAVARAFFAEYELRFNVGSVTFGVPTNRRMSAADKAQRTSDVEAMVPELLTRRNRRAAAALKRRVFVSKRVSSGLAPAARRLSAAQLALFREFFPDRSGGINFEAFQFAYEIFANGEIRDPARGSGFGEPDGGFYFMFAEFAFFCVASSIDISAWAKALRTFVKTQEIFMHIYRPGSHHIPPSVWSKPPKAGSMRRGLDDYRHANFSRAGQSSKKRKMKLRRKYDRMSLGELRRSARDNMLRAQRMR